VTGEQEKCGVDREREHGGLEGGRGEGEWLRNQQRTAHLYRDTG
jgi:hypothetical protein